MKMQKSVIFVKKKLKINIRKINNIVKLEIIVIIQGNIEVLRTAYEPKNIPIAFFNGSNYDYHFIMKELAESFKNNLFAQKKTLKNR